MDVAEESQAILRLRIEHRRMPPPWSTACSPPSQMCAWDRPFNRSLRGLADYRLGRFDDAITTLASGEAANSPPADRLITAMARHQKGQKGQALKTLAAVSSSFDWTPPRAEIGSARIPYILRREAAMLILPNLPAFMEDRYQPQDHDERLALLGACQDTNRCLALARLYADIFRADPSLAENLAARHRYNAARAAAQAGCGLGKDSAERGELERKKWRAQAHIWLGEDLASHQKRAALPDAAAGVPRAKNYIGLTDGFHNLAPRLGTDVLYIDVMPRMYPGEWRPTEMTRFEFAEP